MYNPPHFREDRPAVLHELIREHGLATLVTAGPDGLVADHIPMLVDPEPAPLGTLRGHVARANPVWRALGRGAPALAVFHGPQGYVSPAWYPSKAEGGRVVPTWNYVVVHAHGVLRGVEDRDWLRALVERLTDRHEGGRPDRWRLSDAPADFLERQLGAIVGLELAIGRLEGKWKLSQNRAPEDRQGVVRALRAAGGAAAALAALVETGGAPRAAGAAPEGGGPA